MRLLSVLQNPFQAERELDGLSKVLVDLKQPVLYAGAAVFLAVAALLGSLVGTKAPGEQGGSHIGTFCLCMK